MPHVAHEAQPPHVDHGGRPAFAALAGRGELLATAHQRLREAPGLLLTGPAGIGKSTLVAALAAGLADDGTTVLRCAPAPEDTRLPYLGIIDLFARVPEEVVAGLPPGPREALRAVLLPGWGAAGETLAVRVAVLEALRLLARRQPLVLVVDGLQWLDEPSAEVLAFVARRIEDSGIRIVAAERVPDGPAEGPTEGTRTRCCPPGTAEIAVPPLTDDDIALLLLSSGAALPPSVLRSVRRTAAGNPWYALELGRCAPREGLTAEAAGFLPVPERLRALVLAGVRELAPSAVEVLLVAAAATRPGLALLGAAVPGEAGATLAEAERLGVTVTDVSGAVRFRHPLVRAALYADATGAARRRAHAVLARVVGEPLERARHLALARPVADEATAAGLMAVVKSARGHGEPSALAELAELAARRTPAHLSGERDQRLLAAAEFACDAGHREESERAAEAVLNTSGSPTARVRARLVLLRDAGQALWDKGPLIDAGLRDAAGDPALEAALYHWAALRGLLCGELDAAAGYARRSAARAALAASTDTHLAALSTLARVHSLSGHPGAAEAALTQAVTLSPDASPLRRMRAVLALDSDDIPQALTHLLPLFPHPAPEFLRPALPEPSGQEPNGREQPAGVEDFVASLVALVRVQVRAGECRGAVRSAAWCVRVAGAESGPAVYAEALAETYGGRVERARELAARAVRASEADGDRLFLIRALAVQGQAALFGGDRAGAAQAVESLRRVLEIGTAMRAADPPLLSWYADLAEALVTLGETDAAQDVLAEAYRWVPPSAPGSVWASLERARGRWEAATGDPKEGAALLRSSAERLRALVLPVDLVRTLTALGAVERRARHRTAAREALTEALELAERTGAAPLADRARDELARVDAAARGASGDRLTPAEARIVELVRGGATNREVATALFISVKTVEGTLSRLFRKFGVRTRTALAHQVSRETHG